jgi:ribokinase
MTSPSTIIVVGSANQDYLVRVSSRPGPGETVIADSLLCQPGGKGANQAVAAARLGGHVSFVGCVGDDADGSNLLTALRTEGIDTSQVRVLAHQRTGLALISVDDRGENSITVVPGTNYALDARQVQSSIEQVAGQAGSAVVLVQAEVPTAVIAAVLATATAIGSRCIFNLAPFQPLDPATLAGCDPLVVNEVEAAAWVGWPVDDIAAAQQAAEQIQTVCRSVVVTLGPQGAWWADANGVGLVRAEVVDPVDTTGAGDAFMGALAVFLAAGYPLATAVTVAVRAGTYAVRSPGAQSSYPKLAELGL